MSWRFASKRHAIKECVVEVFLYRKGMCHRGISVITAYAIKQYVIEVCICVITAYAIKEYVIEVFLYRKGMCHRGVSVS